MGDPGRAYLYAANSLPSAGHRRQRSDVGPMRTYSSQQPDLNTLAMSALPTEVGVKGGSIDWGAALGNIENAKVAVDTFKSLLEDAVFLDEEAFTNASTLSMYQHRLQLQQRRIRELEHEAEALRMEVLRKEELLQQEKKKSQDLVGTTADLKQELENNAVVFKMHYQELLNRNEEISRLKAIIEGLDGAKG